MNSFVRTTAPLLAPKLPDGYAGEWSLHHYHQGGLVLLVLDLWSDEDASPKPVWLRAFAGATPAECLSRLHEWAWDSERYELLHVE